MAFVEKGVYQFNTKRAVVTHASAQVRFAFDGHLREILDVMKTCRNASQRSRNILPEGVSHRISKTNCGRWNVTLFHSVFCTHSIDLDACIDRLTHTFRESLIGFHEADKVVTFHDIVLPF